jgi:hypothetical protein
MGQENSALRLSRRSVLRLGLGAASGLLVPQRSRAQSKKKPVVLEALYRNDFWGLHRGNEEAEVRERQRARGWLVYDTPGLNIHLEKRAPLHALARGAAFFMDELSGSGKRVYVDLGLFYAHYAHLDEIRVTRGQAVDRNTIIGLEGNTGTHARGVVHLAVTLFGNALIQNDINYVTGETSRGPRVTYFPQTEIPDMPLRVYFLVDPDRMTANGKQLVDAPWDGKADYDAPYEQAVRKVKESYAALLPLVRDHRGDPEQRIWEMLLQDGWIDGRLYEQLNFLWQYIFNGGVHWQSRRPFTSYLEQKGIGLPPKKIWELRPENAGDDALLRQVYQIVEDTNAAARLFKITSPYRV